MADVSGITAALPAQQQIDPLQAATTIQGIQNSQVLNKLYQQDLLNKQQELQNLQLTNQTGQSTLAMAQRQRNGQLLFGLSNMSDKQLQGGGPIYQTLQSELNDGNATIDAQRYPAMKAEIDKITQNGGDQDGSLYRPLLNRGLTYSMAGPEAAAFLTGTRETSTTPGGLTQVVQVPGLGSAPGTPTRNLGTPYGGGLTPQEGVQPITIYLSDGTSRQITGQEARQYQLNGLPPGLSWSPNGGAAAPGAATAPPPGTDVHPGTVAPIGTGSIPGMGGAIPNDQQKAAAIESQKQASTGMQNVSSRSWADMQGSLQSVINLAGKVQTGPGTDSANYMKQLISNISPSLAASLGIDPSKANDTQEMAKMLARISSAGGYGSDAQMFENIASNPSNKMNPDALRRAAGYVKSLNDQEEVLTRAANDQATHQPLNMQTWYGNTRGQIQAGLDQGTFRVPYMSDPEYADYRKSLNTPDKINAAKHTLDLMHQYLRPPMALAPSTQPQAQ